MLLVVMSPILKKLFERGTNRNKTIPLKRTKILSLFISRHLFALLQTDILLKTNFQINGITHSLQKLQILINFYSCKHFL